MNFTIALTLVGIILCETTAQYFLQKRVKASNNIYLITGMTFYAIVGLIYYFMLKNGEKLAIANTLWNAGTAVTIPIIGYFIFKQTLTKKQIFGMIIVLLGVSLL